MATTEDDLLDFTRFTEEKLLAGEVWSLADLAREWEESRRYADSVAALQEAHAEAETGQARPIAEEFSDIRRRLGQSE